MKKVFLFSISLILCGLMTGCGSKNETHVYEKDGFTVTFEAPKGFFTRSTERADFLRSNNPSGAVAFIGKTYTMMITVYSCNYTLESWSAFNKGTRARMKLFQEVEIEGAHAAYRAFQVPNLQYEMLAEIGEYCMRISFCQNDIKKATNEEVRNTEMEAGFLKKCTELSNDKVLLEIMKSVKIKKN